MAFSQLGTTKALIDSLGVDAETVDGLNLAAGTLAARPDAATFGAGLYVVLDKGNRVDRSDGAAWTDRQEEFSYTGAAQTFTVPADITEVTIEAWGAQGYDTTHAAGRGGYAKGTIAVTPGEVLNVYVGQAGQRDAGGWNGGGWGGNAGWNGGGGGATDVRQGGTALADRVIVAGGGGGAGADSGEGGDGGSGIGQPGADGIVNTNAGGGRGGTQTAGGAAGNGTGAPTAGALGVGGNGVYNGSVGGNTGSGGGGYYGGGAGDTDGTVGGNAGGGGGSNYVTGSDTETERGVRSGAGRVVVSW